MRLKPPKRSARAGLCASLALASILIPGHARAEIPHSSPEEAYTKLDYRAELIAAHHKLMCQAYRKVGHTDPKWDKPAELLIKGYANLWPDNVVDRWNNPQSMPLNTRLALGKKAVQAGCDDPLVLHCHGTTLEVKYDEDFAVPTQERAAVAMLDSDYSITFKAYAATRIRSAYRGDNKAEYQHWQPIAQDYLRRAFLTREDPPIFKRRIIQIYSLDDPDPLDEVQAMYQAAKAHPNPDPWAYHMACGWYWLAKAYQANAIRPPQFRQSVSKAGQQDLARARDHLVKAWKVRPSFPEAPAAMMTIAMTGVLPHDKDPRLWFDRTAQAQFDYMPAYHHMIQALSPAWGGSQQAMIDFGLQCAKTHRYDTNVPFQLMEILFDIREDAGGSYAAWRGDAVADAVDGLLAGLAQAPSRDGSHDYFETYRAAADWRCDRFRTAADVLKKLGRTDKYRPWHYVDASEDYARMEIAAMTGPAAATLRATLWAHRAHRSGLLPAIAYRHALDQAPHHEQTLRYVRHWVQANRQMTRFRLGQTVDLIPDPTENGGDPDELPGWTANHGLWKIENGALIGTVRSDKRDDLLALLHANFGAHWQMAGAIHFLNTPLTEHDNLGPLVSFANRNAIDGYTFYPDDQWEHVEALDDWQTNQYFRANVGPDVHFYLERWNDRATLFVNGQAVAINRYVEGVPGYVGLIGPDLPGGTQIRIEDLTIRQLAQAPVWYNKN